VAPGRTALGERNIRLPESPGSNLSFCEQRDALRFCVLHVALDRSVCGLLCKSERQEVSTLLLDLVLDAHGAARWKRFRGIQGDMPLWAKKGWPDVLRKVRVTADIAKQHISYWPFTADGLRSFYRPDLVAIDTLDGKHLKQRANPRDAFAGHTPATQRKW
jgi:hypothetical protein